MKANILMIDDSLRLENFLDALPKDILERLIAQLSERRLSPELSLELEGIRNFLGDPLSTFSNSKIKKAQQKFNKSFNDIDDFQLHNFKQHGFNDYCLNSNLPKESEEWLKLTRQLKMLTKYLRVDYEDFLKIAIQEISAIKSRGYSKEKNPIFTENLKPELSIDKLDAYSDGTIRYNNEILWMRNQMKDLCRLFMEHPNRTLTIDDIKETIICSNKRATTSKGTISKYVSELRRILNPHFGKEVFINQKDEGWRFEL